MSTLVVAAHPDDEVLGCGATIAGLSRSGEDVHVLILGEGATSRADERSAALAGEVNDLSAMAARAGQVLGAASVALAGLPDNRFDSVDLLDIVKRVEQQIEMVAPSTVFTHHGADRNVDHRLTHEAVLTATRPVPGSLVRDVYAFEVLSSSEWGFASNSFRPNVFVDATATLDDKHAALAIYAAEMREFPHPRSHRAVDALAAVRGSTAGLVAAEAFELVRSVR